MCKKVVHAVPTGIRMIFVRDALGCKLLVQRGRTGLETIVITLPAIEINGRSLESVLVLFGQREGIVRLPMGDVDRIPDQWCQSLSGFRSGSTEFIQFFRRLDDQSRALDADGGKHFRISKGKTKSAVAAHRNTGDGARFPSRLNAVFL